MSIKSRLPNIGTTQNISSFTQEFDSLELMLIESEAFLLTQLRE